MRWGLCVAWAVVAVMIPGGLVFASPPHPPPAPLGWGEKVTPGFTPSIEDTLVNKYFATDEELRGYGKSWGPGAAPVLMRLYESKEWVDYRWRILEFLDILDPPEFSDLLQRRFLELVREQDLPPPTYTEFERVLRFMAKHNPDASLKLVSAYVASASDKVREGIVQGLRFWPKSDTLVLLQNLKATAKDPSQLRDIDYKFADELNTQRAQEPMSVILQREADERAAGR